MKRIAIIGAGIVGATAAYYLSQLTTNDQYMIQVYDEETGQATKAAAGIISPWLSKRRNQHWYRLARQGAELIPQLAQQIHATGDMYRQNGTIITRSDGHQLEQLYQLALKRRSEAPSMGTVERLTAKQVHVKLPILTQPLPGVFLSGGGQMNGAAFVNQLLKISQTNNVKVINQAVHFNANGDIVTENGIEQFDQVIVATGAWMKKTLEPLGIVADVRPQKGQLIEVATERLYSGKMPVLMPEGERDFLPVDDHHFIVGATHENEMGFDLTPSPLVEADLLNSAQRLVGSLHTSQISRIKVGTRAYTSDYGPFFGLVPNHDHILVGGGLGSSGLTTGPMMGKLLAKMATENNVDWQPYTKPIDQYLTLM